MLFNTTDGIVQYFTYGDVEFPIHNRNLESSEQIPLGYLKKISNSSMGRVENNNTVYSQSSIMYDMEWNFMFSAEELEDFFSLLTVNMNDISSALKNSVRIYSPTQPRDKFILKDNKVKDFFTRDYEHYYLSITEIGEITHYSLGINKINIKGVGERV